VQPTYPPQYQPQGGPQYGPPPGQYQPGPPQAGYGQPAPPAPATPAAPIAPGGWRAPEQGNDGDRVKATDLDGHLLIVVAESMHEGFFPAKAEKVEVRNGQNVVTEAAKPASDAVKVNLVDLDAIGIDGQPGKTYIGVMWGGKVLAKGLAKQLGVPVLARMGKGQARGSNAAPAILLDQSADPSACARADQFVNRRPNWQAEPTELPTGQPANGAPAGQYPPQQYAPQGQPAPMYSTAPGQPYPPQGYPAQPGMPPQYGQPMPAGPQYPPPGGYAPQGYAAAPAAGPGSPEAQAAYANMQYQQHPQQYQQ
jgi:hypothetical protein